MRHQPDHAAAAAAPVMPAFLNFFDRWLAVALAYFHQRRVDVIILETGVGGRHDATRHVPIIPRVCAITSISFDHVRQLSDLPSDQPIQYTDDILGQIASNKAGIIRANVAVVSSTHQAPVVLRALHQEADAVGASSVELVPPEYSDTLALSLHNDNTQRENAAIARRCIELVLEQQQQQHLIAQALDGLQHTYWPCRYEKLTTRSGVRIVIDGAHNQDSVSKLFRALAVEYGVDSRLFTIFGCTDESRKPMLNTVYQASHQLLLVDDHHASAVKAHDLLLLATELDHQHPSHQPYSKVLQCDPTLTCASTLHLTSNALAYALSAAAPVAQSVIVVCGSLYLARLVRVLLHTASEVVFPEHDWVYQHDA
jgi:folylpolyglutamate synthase/dihydrofolate synthase